MIKNLKIGILSLLIVMMFTSFLFAQEKGDKRDIIYNAKQQVNSVPCLNKTYSIVVHFIDDNVADMTPYNDVIDEANAFFADLCVEFQIIDTNNIENWNYDMLYFKMPEDSLNRIKEELITKNYVQNVINIYVADELISEGASVAGLGVSSGNCGVEYKNDIVYISDFEANVVAHELGHMLGLAHTFEADNDGAELVDGSNCATAGDKICDTNADFEPNDPQKAQAALDCGAVFSNNTDANGAIYLPPTDNVMSYWPSECTCRFTPGQFIAMESVLTNCKSHLR